MLGSRSLYCRNVFHCFDAQDDDVEGVVPIVAVYGTT